MVDLRRGDKASHPGRERPSFDRIVGQDDLVEALTLVAVDPDLDGLLVRGEKGTAKSTAVRALAAALPTQTAVADCPYGCHPTDESLGCADCRARTDPPTETRPAPLVTLPLGATRERVVGTLSVADAMAGDAAFDPGLLARAHRGLLYVDEVNLLDDHLVDVLLDAAAGGVNRVERDGVSVVHPTEFTLIGTMNPEEGELRPQLRDRFALSVRATGCEAVADRVAIVEGALDGWTDEGAATETDHTARIRRGRERLADVTVPRDRMRTAAVACRDAGVDGHRADVATVRAARGLAALDGRERVAESDVRRGAELALAHRLRSKPFEPDRDPDDVLDDAFDGSGDGEDESGDGGDGTRSDGDQAEGTDEDSGADESGDGGRSTDGAGEGRGSGEDSRNGSEGPDPTGAGDAADRDSVDASDADGGDAGQDPNGDGSDGGPGPDPGADRSGESHDAGSADAGDGDDGGADGDGEDEAHPVPPGGRRRGEDGDPAPAGPEPGGIGGGSSPDLPIPDPEGEGGDGQGRASADPTPDGEGPRVRTTPAEPGDAVDAAASVRATASRGGERVRHRDLRQSVTAGDARTLVLFVVDASASMRPAMRAAKETVLELLRDAYRERDEVGVVAFAGSDADVLLPPTDSVTLAARHLKRLPTADRTPLPAGLATAADVLDRADPAGSVVVLVTDGRANVAEGSPTAATRAAARRLATQGASVLAVDADEDRRGLLDVVVSETDAERVPLGDLSAARVDAAAGGATPDG